MTRSSVKRRSSHRSSKIRPITMPLEPLKEFQGMDTTERIFLEAVERGDKHTVIRCLQGNSPVNVNCTNMLGRSAIQIAVDNENVELVEVLLQQDGVRIGDALLYAIREGVYKIVEMLIDHPSITLEMLGSDWSKCRRSGEESSDYSQDISPIILASHCNQFEILQLLILRGAEIKQPHQLSCSCKVCQEHVHEDSLRHSLLRINTYKALASPAWISLTSPDPILTAFRLSWVLQKLALRENEFKDTYMHLSEQCKKYACDLIDQCRTSEEVIAVLNKESDEEEADHRQYGLVDNNKLTLARLKLALKYEQKQFVAHPHCQQLLTSIWYEGLPGWRKRNGVTKFLLCIGLILLVPFMAVYYLIFPRSKIGQLLRSPFMKFLYHSASFGVFLFLLVCVSTEISGDSNRERFRGPPPSQLEWFIVFWVTGFVWQEVKQLWDEGLKAYIRQWWNWLDFIMLSLYLATFSLRLVAYILIKSDRYGPREMARSDWPSFDPTLISESLFAVANVFSFSRIIYLFQANQHLGPMQISLGCMLIDIAKFLFIFFLVLTSFACGLNQLYWYYNGSRSEGDPDSFYTLGESYITLYWSLFGLTALKDIKIPQGQYFTELMGMLLFMAYHGMASIVLINMLIAMMSNSYQNIENHADMEWKFCRSKLWMGYFDEGSTLPAPFNLIVSPKSIYYCLRSCHTFLCQCFRSRRYKKRRTSSATNKPIPSNVHGTTEHGNRLPGVALDNLSVFTTGESGSGLRRMVKQSRSAFNGEPYGIPPSYSQLIYQDVMRRLVSRYIHQTKKQRQQDGVNEDDLLEIKQDISSLRYELREDRKREIARGENHFESLKLEILSVVKGRTSTGGHHYGHGGSCQDIDRQGTVGSNLSVTDIQHLKQDIISSLRQELRDAVSELSNYNPGHVLPGNVALTLPPTEPELYHTHLYTQL
ncbi:transient-receptor-potential-like protein [Pecten maximus]|uniref:transient-receptor-potential-like protein n=1 Tax=Pecten maximus TaxID=6579 RepID=UPI00145896A4|nr:transient-receptor-potential-like protein [Pecten maximus]